jgi:pimeloyl-ACP methyl ester carboxylesterase
MKICDPWTSRHATSSWRDEHAKNGTVRFLLPSLLISGCLTAACSSHDRPASAYHDEILPEGTGPDAAVPPPSTEGAYTRAPCPFVPPLGIEVDCGYLTVAENRKGSSPKERGTLELAVGVFKSGGPSPSAPPLLYLDGGPGGPALDDVVGGWPLFQSVAIHGDLVVFDQRGTGHSKPSLVCDESLLKGDAGSALQACRDDLAGKVLDLSNFDSASSAADVDELRRALGLPAWNVFGVSYGTRLALTVARDHPANIGSIVIDSVLPPQVDALAQSGTNANRAFELIFDNCAAQDACARAFPNLRDDFYATLDQLAASPAPIPLSNGSTFFLDADFVIDLVFSLCYAAEVIPFIPEIIEEFHLAQFDALAAALSTATSPGQGSNLAVGMNLSVVCREMAPFTSRQAYAQANADLPPALRAHFGAADQLDECDVWKVAPAGAIEHQAVISDIPALVLSGGFDPVTPPAWGKLAATTLSKGIFLEVPSQAHGVFENPCAGNIIEHFVRNPGMPPDTNCTADLPAITFAAPTAPPVALLVRSQAHPSLPDSAQAAVVSLLRHRRPRRPRF